MPVVMNRSTRGTSAASGQSKLYVGVFIAIVVVAIVAVFVIMGGSANSPTGPTGPSTQGPLPAVGSQPDPTTLPPTLPPGVVDRIRSQRGGGAR